MPQHSKPWNNPSQLGTPDLDAPSTKQSLKDAAKSKPIQWDKIDGKPSEFPPTPAAAEAIGGVYEAAHIAPLTAAPTMEDFNNLLAALQGAGVIAEA